MNTGNKALKSHMLPLRAFVGLGASGPSSVASAPPSSSGLDLKGVVETVPVLLLPPPVKADLSPLEAAGAAADPCAAVSSHASLAFPLVLAVASLSSPAKTARRPDAVGE